MRHHALLILYIFFQVEMWFHHVGQAGLELLASGDPSASASQSAVITGVSHHALPLVTSFLSGTISSNRLQVTPQSCCPWYKLHGDAVHCTPRPHQDGEVAEAG